VSEVTFGDTKLDPKSWHLDSKSRVLRVDGLDKMTEKGAWTADWALKWS
jgi:alpha-glucosidase